MTERRFLGTVALITGGSSGIGRAAALGFAREGAMVVIASRGAERGERVRRELEALGAEAEFIPTDVSQSGQVERLISRTIARFGRLNYAFNNAAAVDVGVFKPSADFSWLTGLS
jgi:NAD(P)-dependent dehydrogenase (short-subunit alcohol dehydrogenase family)